MKAWLVWQARVFSQRAGLCISSNKMLIKSVEAAEHGISNIPSRIGHDQPRTGKNMAARKVVSGFDKLV